MLLLPLLACGGDAPWAQVDVDRDSPFDPGKRLLAYFLETSATRSGAGDAVLVLLDEEAGCDTVLDAADPITDDSHPFFSWKGLAFSLSFDSGDAATELTWEDLYWGDEAASIVSQRTMSAWLLTGEAMLALDGGWLELTEHSNELVAGHFDVRWFTGEFAAEHCGVMVPGSDDAGDDTGG